MSHRNVAAKGSRRPEECAPTSNTNPGLESRPFGVAADRKGPASEDHEVAKECRRIADALESLVHSRSQGVAPEALSMEGAAGFLGVSVSTIKELVRTRKLAYVQVGSQRGRVFLVVDLRDFLKKNRRPSGDEKLSRKQQA